MSIKILWWKLKNLLKKSPFYWRTLLILFIIAIIAKTIVIYLSYRNLNPILNCVSYFVSDIFILLIFFCFIAINTWIKKRQNRIINNVIMLFILIFFCIDIFSISLFQSRVSIQDFFMFAVWSWSWSNVKHYYNWAIVYLITLLFVFFVVFLLIQKIKIKNNKQFFSKILLVSIIWYIDIILVCNVFNIKLLNIDNILTLNILKIKEQEWKKLEEIEEKKYENYVKNEFWEWEDINIILVFDESLSAIDSKNIWWYDNMPWFDKIQKKWITYTNFITNWTTSDTAHIATLLWVMPLMNIWVTTTPYSWYRLQMKALPDFLNSQWYKTTFISAVSLKFLNQRNFLSWAWFQKIIGEEEFIGKKAYTFESAPDEDLYERVLEEVESQTWKFFIWLQTISFHKSYDTPYWNTQEDALKYSDDKLYEFYMNLDRIWYFDSWILIIVWDHRMMNPAKENEAKIFWPNRYTRSVATVVGSWVTPGQINSNIIQHTDFYNSIKKKVWKWVVQLDSYYNDIFTNKTNRDRWITNSKFYENNRYTVSFLDKNPILFKNISSLKEINHEVFDYFSSYLSFEFWNNKNDDSGQEINLIWHRGSTENEVPENTIEAFLSAKAKWARWVEFDVSFSRDKQNFVAHWEKLYASNCKNTKVWSYTFDRVFNNCFIKNWERYRSFRSIMEMLDGLFDYYFVELKVYKESRWEEQALDAIETIRDLNMQDRVIFISYSDAARKVFSEQDDIIRGRDTFNTWDIEIIWDNNSQYFLLPYDYWTPELIDKTYEIWKIPWTYTVNTTWDYQLVKDLWIKFIMTDTLTDINEYEQKNLPRIELLKSQIK